MPTLKGGEWSFLHIFLFFILKKTPFFASHESYQDYILTFERVFFYSCMHFTPQVKGLRSNAMKPLVNYTQMPFHSFPTQTSIERGFPFFFKGDPGFFYGPSGETQIHEHTLLLWTNIVLSPSFLKVLRPNMGLKASYEDVYYYLLLLLLLLIIIITSGNLTWI